MKVYRLKHNNYSGEIIFGLPEEYCKTEGEQFINKLVKNMKPWTHAIPYYNKCKFGFISLNALMTFLFHNTDITHECYYDIMENFSIESYELHTWSSGLSKFMCTYFDDEINEDTYEEVDMKLLEEEPYNIIWQDPVPKPDISFCKESYYSKVKTYYNN